MKNVLSGYDPSAETKPALSGYALVGTANWLKLVEWIWAPTIFRWAFSRGSRIRASVASDSHHALDKYNMGYVTLTDKDGAQRVEKVHAQTQTYPYLVHTPSERTPAQPPVPPVNRVEDGVRHRPSAAEADTLSPRIRMRSRRARMG